MVHDLSVRPKASLGYELEEDIALRDLFAQKRGLERVVAHAPSVVTSESRGQLGRGNRRHDGAVLQVEAHIPEVAVQLDDLRAHALAAKLDLQAHGDDPALDQIDVEHVLVIRVEERLHVNAFVGRAARKALEARGRRIRGSLGNVTRAADAQQRERENERADDLGFLHPPSGWSDPERAHAVGSRARARGAWRAA